MYVTDMGSSAQHTKVAVVFGHFRTFEYGQFFFTFSELQINKTT